MFDSGLMVGGILSCRLRGSGGLVVNVAGLVRYCLGEVAFEVERMTFCYGEAIIYVELNSS